MSATKTRARPRKEDADRLSCSVKGLVTPNELIAVDLLATDVYQGRSDLMRHAIALLIRSNHKDLEKYLRQDLKTP
jgi:hypothetical protein